MNNTINISLPSQLKLQADEAVNNGHYASFSDLVRSGIRVVLGVNTKYDIWLEEAKLDMKQGRGLILKNDSDIDNFVNSL